MGKVQSKYSPIVDHASNKYYGGSNKEELNQKLTQDEGAFEMSLKDLHKDHYQDIPYDNFRANYISKYGDPFLKKKEQSAFTGIPATPTYEGMQENVSQPTKQQLPLGQAPTENFGKQ